MYRLSATESLINGHIYVSTCATSSLLLPGLCNCNMFNGCGRLIVGHPLVPVVFDTPYTFVCADSTVRYDLVLVALNKQTNNVYYFWQSKAGLSQHARANT